MAGTITRITIGPIQNHTPQPVSAHMPYPTKARDGTTSPISQRYRFPSFQSAVDPAGTVLFAVMGHPPGLRLYKILLSVNHRTQAPHPRYSSRVARSATSAAPGTP